MVSHAVIVSLPVAGADRSVLIDAANAAFDAVLERIEPNNEALTRSFWDAGDYVDNQLFAHLITPDKLPMPRDEVAYYIDVFLVHHVIGLATEADSEASESRLEPRRP
ncbi:hypothetical protein NKH47_08310 [Mesorhizobium sp. M1060]|uniref:hypothetical protein n=1 Tax=Mesorhizobium sp. M1060 TaxID=2957052 RepID=UPI00333B53F6